MRKFFFILLFFLLIVFLLVMLSYFIDSCFLLSRDILYSKDFLISMGILALILLGIVFMYFINYKRGVSVELQNKQLNIKEGEEVVLFAPFSVEELDKINAGRNIVKFLGFTSEKEGIGFHIIQRGIFDDQELRLYSTSDYQILFNNDEIANVNTPGLCLCVKVVNGISQIKKDIAEVHSTIAENVGFFRLLEISNGDLFFKYGYVEIVKDRESANLFLKTAIDVTSGRSFYNLLLQKVFTSCPNDKKSLYSLDKSRDGSSVEDQVDNLWINGPDGQMALFILNNFPPSEIVGSNKVSENRAKDLNRKICLVQSYIKQHGEVIEDESCLNRMIEALRDIQCQVYNMNSYNSLYQDYYINDKYDTISSLMCQDLNNGNVDPYIFAIASYESSYYFDETSIFFRKLLCSKGYSDVIKHTNSLLIGYLDESIANSPYYEKINIESLLPILSMDENCKGQELIESARKYILKRYMSRVGVFYNRSFSIKIGSVKNIVLMSGIKTSEVAIQNVVELNSCVEV